MAKTSSLSQHPFCTVHGVFLDIFNQGVLLEGDPGCGKSDFALALLSRGHRLIADDAPCFYRSSAHQLMGYCPEPIQNLLEIRSLGIVNVCQLFGEKAILLKKTLDLVIQFVPSFAIPEARKLSIELEEKTILDISIPKISLSLDFSDNMAILIESATRLALSLHE